MQPPLQAATLSSSTQSSQQQQQFSDILSVAPELRNRIEYQNVPPVFLTEKRLLSLDVAKHRAGKWVATIQAHDEDGDRLKFSLKQADSGALDASQYFTIDSASGELKLSSRQLKYKPIATTSKQAELPTEKEAVEELALNQYSLIVCADDGVRDTLLELSIQVTNSTLKKERESRGWQVDDEEVAAKLRNFPKQNKDFFDKLYSSMAANGKLTSNVSAAAIILPHFNPGLSAHSDLAEKPTQGEIFNLPTESPLTVNFDFVSTATKLVESAATQAPILSMPAAVAAPSPSSSASGLASQRIAVSPMSDLKTPITMSAGPAAHQRVSPEMTTTNLLIVMCSCLMIALVLLMFIIPLSVKRLRKRLKRVELQQHEHLSQKSSNVSSTMGGCSSLASTAHRHQSLSRFTSDGSCMMRRDSSSIFRQSSLDSSLMTMSTNLPHNANQQHTFNRVDGGSIANPVYLHKNSHQQHQFHPPPFDFKQNHSAQQQAYGLQAPVNAINENVYYPLSDDFYSTIQTDAAPLSDGSGFAARKLPPTTNPGTLANQTVAGSNYLMAQCAQPNVAVALESELIQLDSPLSSADDSRGGGGGRNFNRPHLSPDAKENTDGFLTLPARHSHWSLEDDEAAEGGSRARARPAMPSGAISSASKKYDILQQLSCGLPSAFAATNSAGSTDWDQQVGARTIARTCNVDREQAGWELERSRLRSPWVLLDQGQFGQVWRCKLSAGGPRQPERVVAVKMLKKNNDDTSSSGGERGRDELLAEIEIMKLVCGHPNVVKLLHCCTTGDKPVYLIMEYIEQGKLQSYLEKSRINHHFSTSLYADEVPPTPPPSSNDSNNYLTSRDLMKFIFHVAKGMEYISSKCIVHRDLASRNILVSGQKICKIGDFGMARHMQSVADVYERHSGNCKIPVRWMAPEVLLSNSFTSKSDVFSFGILMWEIITLGSTPYTHLKTEQVIDRVARGGERPERPEYCHPELYSIMSQCWQQDSAARPTFKNLVDILGELVLSANNYIELDQYPDHNYYNIPETAAPGELL